MAEHPDEQHPPTTQGELQHPPGTAPAKSALDGYHSIAETVGGMPSLRWKDNLYQAAFVSIGAVVGAGIGWFTTKDTVAAMLGAIAGLIVTVVLSGVVLMVLGWVRVAKRRK